MGFTKLDSGIVDSSIWNEDAETCKVWISLLALCDCEGCIRGSVGWLAWKSKVDRQKCQKAIEQFLAPDTASRNPANEGRRIIETSNGWQVLNYAEYRAFSYSSKPSAVRMRRHRASLGVTCDEVASHSASASASASKQLNGSISPSVVAINNREALRRLEQRQGELRGRFPLTLESEKSEWVGLKAERQRLMSALNFKA